jgi:hypothetical protein
MYVGIGWERSRACPHVHLSICEELAIPSCDMTFETREESDAHFKRPSSSLVYIVLKRVVAGRISGQQYPVYELVKRAV